MMNQQNIGCRVRYAAKSIFERSSVGSGYLANQYVAFTRNTLLGCVKMSLRSRPARNSPSYGSNALRICCHTKNNVEPGRYSHLTTALPRSDWNRKSGLATVKDGAAPFPSGSTR